MSFFRNLRSSITRGRSSSRDTTPVRTSRPGSVISSLNSSHNGNGGGNGSGGKRRDSIESRTDSLFNRSETFILDESQDVTPIHSNCSTLEKKSKKSKVLEKFSTFTKRKKTPTPDTAAFEHHPSDNATNTYYKWQADGVNSLEYDSQSDPFNFLYERQSSLKSQHNTGSSSNTESIRSGGNTTSTYDSTTYRKEPRNNFDSSTYRKGKMPTELKKQLVQLKQTKNLPEQDNEEYQRTVEEDLEPIEGDKYKTVTLNSFRKSFRDKFLQQQKEAPHNPAWFVEVEPPADNKPRESSKENRRDLLVFENDNYRPGSRSPIRDLNNRKANNRSQTRSPVKRNETFKVERISRQDRHLSNKPEESMPSIRIEFKNSITPHMPGRMVPLGVAKPMPSQVTNTYYTKPENIMNTSYTIKSSSSTRLNNHSPSRNWSKAQSPSRHNNMASNNRSGRYQTLVQIKNDKSQQSSPLASRTSRLSTRIQLGSDSPTTPIYNKRNNSAKSPAKYQQPLKQTYFGETSYTAVTPQQSRILQTSSYNPVTNTSSSTNGIRTFSHVASRTSAAPAPPVYGYNATKYHHHHQQHQTPFQATSTNNFGTRSTPTHSAASNNNTNNNIHHHSLSNTSAFTSTTPSYLKNQQPRIIVAAQRRSRSPIKIPWR